MAQVGRSEGRGSWEGEAEAGVCFFSDPTQMRIIRVIDNLKVFTNCTKH